MSCVIREGTACHVHRTGAARLDIVASFKEPVSTVRAAESAYRAVASVLHDTSARIVHERVFGSLAARPVVHRARERFLSVSDRGPFTFIQGQPAWRHGLSGISIHAMADTSAPMRDIVHDRTRYGRAWLEGDTTFFVVQDLVSDDPCATPADQLHQILERAARVLEGQGASFRDVVRTWFYVDDILGWYPKFNAVRNDAYRRFGVLSPITGDLCLIPASTAVGGVNPRRSKVALDLMAVRCPSHTQPAAERLSSASQPEATEYGSSFSRAVALRTPGADVIHVSGTAAIDSVGASVHTEDVAAQASYTLDALSALLAPGGAGLGDVCAATVFVKRPEDAETVWGALEDYGLDDFPGVCIVADICRDELLVEIDAVVALEAGQPHSNRKIAAIGACGAQS